MISSAANRRPKEEDEQKQSLLSDITRIEAEVERRRLEEEIKKMEAAILGAIQHSAPAPAAPSGKVVQTKIVKRMVRKVVRKPRNPQGQEDVVPPPFAAPRPPEPTRMPLTLPDNRPGPGLPVAPPSSSSSSLRASLPPTNFDPASRASRPPLVLPGEPLHRGVNRNPSNHTHYSTNTNLERVASERDFVASNDCYDDSDSEDEEDETIEEEIIEDDDEDDEDDEIIEEIVEDDDGEEEVEEEDVWTAEELQRHQLAAEIAAIEAQLQQAQTQSKLSIPPPPTARPNLMASIAQAASHRDDRIENNRPICVQQEQKEEAPIVLPRINLLASITAAATSRVQRLEATGGALVMQEIAPEVAEQKRGSAQLSFSLAEMITKRAGAREKRLAEGGEKKMTQIKEKSEYQKDFSNICIDAAAMGRLTRLNEHSIEAVAGPKTKEEEWKSQGLLAIQWRSSHMAVIHEAAKLGNQCKMPEKVVSNAPDLEEDWDPENDANHRSPRMAQLLELNQQVGEGQQKVDKLVMGRKEENAGGDSMLVKPMVSYSNIEDVKLPKKKPPKIDPNKVRAQLKTQISRDRPLIDISAHVAEKAWERRTRLDRPGGMPRVTEKCDCAYCLDPSPYQTFAYKELERRKREDGYESADSVEERRQEHERKRLERRKEMERHRREQQERETARPVTEDGNNNNNNIAVPSRSRRGGGSGPSHTESGGNSSSSTPSRRLGPDGKPRRPRPRPSATESSSTAAAAAAAANNSHPESSLIAGKPAGVAVSPSAVPASTDGGCACVIL